MVSLGHLAIDGSKFKANASDKSTYSKKRVADAINDLLDKADQIDRDEDQCYGIDNTGDQIPDEIRRKKSRLQKLKLIKDQLDQSNKEKLNATDPDASFMKTANGIKTSYNAQITVDEAHQVIVAAGVTNDPATTVNCCQWSNRRKKPLAVSINSVPTVVIAAATIFKR
jgi:transposase